MFRRRNRDIRKITAVEDPALLKSTEKLLAHLFALQIDLSKALAEMQTKRAYRPANASSLGDWVARSGCDATDAYRYLRIGRAFESNDELEAKVRSGKVPLRNAELIGRTVIAKLRAEAKAARTAARKNGKQAKKPDPSAEHATPDTTTSDVAAADAASPDATTPDVATPDATTPDAELLEQAETQSPDLFRETVDAEVESRSTGTSRRERVSVFTSKDGREMFRRACRLAARAAGKSLTPGQ